MGQSVAEVEEKTFFKSAAKIVSLDINPIDDSFAKQVWRSWVQIQVPAKDFSNEIFVYMCNHHGRFLLLKIYTLA